MINIENLIRSKQIKIIYIIIHSDLECWNSIGKYWLKKFDDKFGSEYLYFLCQCSDISGLNITSLPSYYQKAIKSLNFLLRSFTVDMQMDVLHQTIFGNARLLFNKKPLFFKSFSKSVLKRIPDIWDYQNKTFLDSITIYIYNKLQNKSNWISEWSKIKTSVPKQLRLKKLRLSIFAQIRENVKLYIFLLFL